MRIAFISIFPEMLQVLQFGMPAQAQKKELLALRAFNPRDYAKGLHRAVDDRPYGGGPGMVMMAEPLAAAIHQAKLWLGKKAPVIYLTPQGRQFTQANARQLVEQESDLILLCGRYEGIDERIIHQLIDQEWSIGDYILSGGELAALILIDVLTRLIPGVLGHPDSNQQDSFSEDLLDYPHYTRPEIFNGERVPEVLLNGNHAHIEKWRKEQSLTRTKLRRPDLYQRHLKIK